MPQGVWGIVLDDACGLQVARHHALDGADMHGRIRSTGVRKQQGHGWALSQTATPMLVRDVLLLVLQADAYLIHRLDGEISGRLKDDSTLAAYSGAKRWPVFVIMAPTGLAFPTAPPRSGVPTTFSRPAWFPLVACGMIEVIGFNSAFQLAMHLIGQDGIAQLPAPPIAGPDMDAQLSRNIKVFAATNSKKWSDLI